MKIFIVTNDDLKGPYKTLNQNIINVFKLHSDLKDLMYLDCKYHL